jgi:hypothetical protein
VSDPSAEIPDDELGGEEWFTIANEFALARVRKVYTRNGERLEIQAPKMGYKILIDPIELESLTWQTHAFFSELLETPFGPEGTSGLRDRGNPIDAQPDP